MRATVATSVVLLVAAPACGPSRAEIEAVVDQGAPLIQAIRKYEGDVGKPPRSLAELVPKYVEAVPGTGLREHPNYLYTVRPGPPEQWALSVRMESLGFKHISYEPSGRYPIPVTPLRDGWVMVSP
jgi:hypothetical protein